MPGRRDFTPKTLAAIAALSVAFAGCDRSNATTGPSNVDPSSFATNLRAQGGDQQNGAVGAALVVPLTVKVVDAGGQPVPGATVTWQTRAGGGSVNPPASSSNANGIVTTTWTLGTTLGANRVVALLSGQFFLDSASFTATATNGPASKVTITTGNNQTANAGRTLPTALGIKVQDTYGYNVSGAKVTWAVPATNGSIAFINADTTAADGTASASWTVGTIAIPQSAFVTVTGTSTLQFNATVNPDTGRVFTLVAGAAQTAAASANLPTALQVKLTDQYGNAIANDNVTWNDSIAGGGKVNPLVSATSATGLTTATWTLGSRAGPQLLRAKSSSGAKITFNASATVAFSDVVVGNFQACGITATNNQMYCWGAGTDGQLGKGNQISANAPTVAVPTAGDTLNGPFIQARQVSAGRISFCTLTIGRQVFCWGRYAFGVPANAPTLQTLADGAGDQVFPNSISIGEDFGCVTDLAGSGYCTGQNLHGQLGNGAAPAGSTPGKFVFISAPPTLWSSISVGRTHACGLPRFNPTATLATQTPSCWGLNNVGQVGNNTATFADQIVPSAVTMPAVTTRFDSSTITTGGAHSCVIEGVGSTTPGSAWCWGSNGFGQLGINVAASNLAYTVPTAVAMPGGVLFTKIVAGESHTCALDAGGGAWCWGRNDYGQLGNGNVGAPATVPIQVTGGIQFRSISVGELYTCGLAAAPGTPVGPSASPGTIYCWGDNSFGQLGNGTNGTNAPVSTPTRVLYQP